MNIDYIISLAASGESEALEFKATTGTRREAAMTVCAFLNQGAGQVLFGVTPDGVVVGQQVSERTIEELIAERQQIAPPAFPTVERVPVDGGREVIVVSTGQGASRPYSYRGTAYRRVGNTTIAMSADEYNRMGLISLITHIECTVGGGVGARGVEPRTGRVGCAPGYRPRPRPAPLMKIQGEESSCQDQRNRVGDRRRTSSHRR